ncbi:MAG: winged helix-turn-helix transcriptional regulator [Nitrososphaerales archaeon]
MLDLEKKNKSDPSNYTYCDSPFACAAAPIISRKWVPVIVCHLLHGPKRYSELRRAVPFLSAKVLSQNLRELEAEEILARQVNYNLTQVEVSYRLTNKGKDLSHVIRAMNSWGKKWLAKLDTNDISSPDTASKQALPIFQP